VAQETGTNLAIDRFGAFEFAYRAGPTDKIIAGNVESYRLQNLVLNYSPKPGDVIIHIGASVLESASDAPDARVFGIEASQDTFNL
jgi:hypothetical protein